MNPRLVKFAVELQNNQCIEEKKYFYFKNGTGKKFLEFLKSAKVTIPIDKNI